MNMKFIKDDIEIGQIIQKILGFLHKDIRLSNLDNFDEVIQLIHVSKDMLQNMNMGLKE